MGDAREVTMRRIMKILGIITVVALLLGSGVVLPVAATPGVTISIDAPAETALDSDFTANVNISEVTNFDACNYDVSFDASVLRLDNVTSGLIGSTTIPVDMYNEISPGIWRVVQNIPDFPGVSGSGYLAVLHFHVVGSEGSSNISLSNGVLSDNTASEIQPTWTGNSVKVAVTASEPTTPPPVVNPAPEAITPPAVVNPAPEAITPPPVVNPAPEATAPNEAAAPLPAKPINWPVLWGVIEGVIVVGLITFLLARRKKAY